MFMRNIFFRGHTISVMIKSNHLVAQNTIFPGNSIYSTNLHISGYKITQFYAHENNYVRRKYAKNLFACAAFLIVQNKMRRGAGMELLGDRKMIRVWESTVLTIEPQRSLKIYIDLQLVEYKLKNYDFTRQLPVGNLAPHTDTQLAARMLLLLNQTFVILPIYIFNPNCARS